MATEERQAADGDTPARSGSGRRRKVRLRGFSPTEREQIAKWIEGHFAHGPETVAKLQLWLRENPDDTRVRNELASWRARLAVARELAYWARTELA